MWFLIVVASFACIFGLAIFQPFFFDYVLGILHIPLIIHVRNIHGLYGDVQPYLYTLSERHPWRLKKNPWRFNVDVNIDGIVNKYHGHY